MKIIFILTSHDKLGDTEQKTGFWLEEFAAPYYIFKDSNAEITLASPRGGRSPMDPKSDEPAFQTESTERFKKDSASQHEFKKQVQHFVNVLMCNATTLWVFESH